MPPWKGDLILRNLFENLGPGVRFGLNRLFGDVSRLALGGYIRGVFGNLAEVAQGMQVDVHEL